METIGGSYPLVLQTIETVIDLMRKEDAFLPCWNRRNANAPSDLPSSGEIVCDWGMYRGAYEHHCIGYIV